MKTIPLIGYSDRLSARPGESIAFKISSEAKGKVTARLFRSISADPNPAGQGIVEEDASAYFDPIQFLSRKQNFHSGSYGLAKEAVSAPATTDLTFSAIVLATKQTGKQQVALACGGYELALANDGSASFLAPDGAVATGQPLTLRHWYRITGRISAAGDISITQTPLGRSFENEIMSNGHAVPPTVLAGRPSVAARLRNGQASDHFNGKIEDPSILANGAPLAAWDFSQGISSTQGHATTGPDLGLINFPARAMTGSRWDGSEMNWRHRPDHYGAIHFHEDDIYDFEWETDFSFNVPADMPSGAYVMRIEADGLEDAMPFFICPPLGQPRAKLCVLVSTFTYTIYGNHARPDYEPEWQKRNTEWNAYPHNPAEYPQYGLSTYNYHSDGSGICHASHLRPLFNLRPGFLTFGSTSCSGLRHLQADSHLLSWLHAKGIDYDIVTDAELHNDGVAAIASYAAVTTGSHPEYHTTETLNALRDYRDAGGSLNYLGGNGFYWRIAVHQENPGLLEIRRAEDGIRAWAAEPGEYYNAFDGGYGGLWRRNDRPPQELVGIGFAAQGEFHGAPYQRTCTDPAYDWIFDGIESDVLGDFGFSGNGAAGFELDHCDTRLGTPPDTVILAQSFSREGEFMLVPEEQLTHLTNLSGGPEADMLRADMVYLELPGGGSVFSTGSITFCGSLPWNGFNNDVSRLLENILCHALAKGCPQ
ncbi:N,N-dimethylformamidase large subunit [Leisingera sp. M527]|uniref:N,N-dimethylformamidase beta subunit family domain-containing protein n=1 Tax=Leisingera sp. M527 TaxID=2867014 RepID=UPI0021A33DA1|nr:N,N-dimethylformamidase beta subunit family domain-containing protein [Leisingera sp. M527]UWQ33030.1 N,N-dimethylformamidase large subunit [Leisingera sp. M527]